MAAQISFVDAAIAAGVSGASARREMLTNGVVPQLVVALTLICLLDCIAKPLLNFTFILLVPCPLIKTTLGGNSQK